MGNPDLYFIIVYAQGRYASKILGRNYNTQIEALRMAIEDFEQWSKAIESMADEPHELNFNICEIVCS